MTAQQGQRLSGRRILVTGGASGIGLATVRLFSREGAAVGVLDYDGEGAAAAAQEVGGRWAQCDVSDPAQVKAAVATIAEGLGGLDGLVNCAGTFAGGLAEEGDYVAWRRNMSINLDGPFLVTAAALPHLKKNPGVSTIVNISSGIGLRPSPKQGAYAASKAGLLAWTKVLAQELGPEIRANATCPGPTDTPLMRVNTPGGDMGVLGAGRALQRHGTPEEQAEAILFLTGPESRFITGVTIPVDGGRTYY